MYAGSGGDLVSPSVGKSESTVFSRGAPDSLRYWTGFAIAVLTWILSAYLILTSLVAVYRFYCPVPYGDMWWFVRDMARLNSHQVGLSYLWGQHSEHRILLPRLIFWADLHLDHFRGVFTILCSSLLLAGEGALICLVFSREKKNNASSKLAYAALVLGMMFSASQIENLIFPFQIQFPLAFFTASASIWLILRHCHSTEYRWSPLVAGLVLALCATLSLGCGLIVWPLLLLISLVEGPSRRTLFTIIIAWCAVWAVYFYGYVSPGDSAKPWISIAQPGRVAAFTLTFMISPLYPKPLGSANILGLLFLLAVVLGLLAYWRFSTVLFKERNGFFVYLALFIISTAVLVSLCRINYGLEEAATLRYRMPALLFWTSIVGLASSSCLASDRPPYRQLCPSLIALLFVALVLLPSQGPTIARFGILSRQIKDDGVAVASEGSDMAYSGLFRLRPDLVRSYVPFLRSNHLAIFADPLFCSSVELHCEILRRVALIQ